VICHECRKVRKVLDNNRTYPWFFCDTDKLQQIDCFWFLITDHSFVCSASRLIFQHIPIHISCILHRRQHLLIYSQIIVASGVIRLFSKSYVLGYHTQRWWNTDMFYCCQALSGPFCIHDISQGLLIYSLSLSGHWQIKQR
jgi:hypothetical protein